MKMYYTREFNPESMDSKQASLFSSHHFCSSNADDADDSSRIKASWLSFHQHSTVSDSSKSRSYLRDSAGAAARLLNKQNTIFAHKNPWWHHKTSEMCSVVHFVCTVNPTYFNFKEKWVRVIIGSLMKNMFIVVGWR